MAEFDERTGIEPRITFADRDNRPALPTSAHWRLDCETTGTALQEWVDITDLLVARQARGEDGPLAHVYADIEIAASLNRIIHDRNRRELKKLYVVANKDTDRAFSVTVKYWIVNHRGMT
jgi:hypothetical protein